VLCPVVIAITSSYSPAHSSEVRTYSLATSTFMDASDLVVKAFAPDDRYKTGWIANTDQRAIKSKRQGKLARDYGVLHLPVTAVTAQRPRLVLLHRRPSLPGSSANAYPWGPAWGPGYHVLLAEGGAG
jgi:hypothetical protein